MKITEKRKEWIKKLMTDEIVSKYGLEGLLLIQKSFSGRSSNNTQEFKVYVEMIKRLRETFSVSEITLVTHKTRETINHLLKVHR